jgi:hypothetical protein
MHPAPAPADCPKSHTITVKAVTPVVNSPTGSFEVTVSQALDGATLNITSVPTGAVCTAGAKTGLTTIYTCTGLSRDVNTVTFQATKDGETAPRRPSPRHRVGLLFLKGSGSVFWGSLMHA